MDQRRRRHDISDRIWGLLESLFPRRKSSWGGNLEMNPDKRALGGECVFAFKAMARYCYTVCKKCRFLYAKNAASFVAAVQIRCIALWADIL